MKAFIETLQKKENQLIEDYTNKELDNLEKISDDLKKQHQDILENLKKINYLLQLVEHYEHNENKNDESQDKNALKEYLDKLKSFFEKLHLSSGDTLSKEDLDLLKKEKNKLLALKNQLQKEHRYIHAMLAKTKAYIIEIQNDKSKDLTKGHDIAQVAQKLLDHFGKKIEETDYNQGKNKIIKFLQNLFEINKIDAEKVFSILEKNNVIYYQFDMANIYNYPSFMDLSDFEDLTYIPVEGSWYINA